MTTLLEIERTNDFTIISTAPINMRGIILNASNMLTLWDGLTLGDGH